ncbi:hypothetical protein [Vibrio harveyi]|uniref:hypothetical protein n=1 Tax=Vibrio harveyi TaxID=669 RepID=UPI0003711F17|nr:hypothetical protein [Vibrio harveyi]
MKTPSYLVALSALTGRDFKRRAVITSKRRFELYDDGKQYNVHNWSTEYQTHIYHQLSLSIVDDKPLYFVDTHCSLTQSWLCSQTYRTIKEVKKAWHGLL